MPEVSHYLDHRNQDIWKEVCKTYTIDIKHHDEKSYGVFRRNNTATIYVPRAAPCIESFTHELLHIWMDLKDVSVSLTLSSTFKTSSFFSQVFKKELGEHIGNCADHYKMLPIYLSLGFERSKFIFDYDSPKCSDIEISLIERWYYNKDFPSLQYAVENYIASYFSIRACPNPKFDYTEYLKRLNQVDMTHYQILEEFWWAFDRFDITTASSIFNSYREFTYPFTENLKEHLYSKFQN